jgi:hypothetical protein
LSNVRMGAVTHLVTLVDVDEGNSDARQMSVSARHEAVLADGRHVLLLDDRGWTSSALMPYRAGEEQPDPWTGTTVEEIEETARVVVGPDEPPDGHSQEDAEESHWAYLADVLREEGLVVDPLELKQLPHEVVLSERLLARIGHGRG